MNCVWITLKHHSCVCVKGVTKCFLKYGSDTVLNVNNITLRLCRGWMERQGKFKKITVSSHFFYSKQDVA